MAFELLINSYLSFSWQSPAFMSRGRCGRN